MSTVDIHKKYYRTIHNSATTKSITLVTKQRLSKTVLKLASNEKEYRLARVTEWEKPPGKMYFVSRVMKVGSRKKDHKGKRFSVG